MWKTLPMDKTDITNAQLGHQTTQNDNNNTEGQNRGANNTRNEL
jgi:hypothetical protein